MRLHSNAVFRLPQHRMIVRVGSGADAVGRASRAVSIGGWLLASGYPAVVPVAGLGQPVVVNDAEGFRYAVTFWWEAAVEPAPPISPSELGWLLRRLHDLPRPPVELPAFRPLDRLMGAVEASSWLRESDRRWLSGRASELEEAVAGAEFGLGPAGLVHGDAQLTNVLRVAGVGPVLADWDGVAVAPREWDLVPMAVEQRFGGSVELLAELLSAYGSDPTGGSGWQVLRDMYELRSVAAHIRRAPVSPPHAVEAGRRLASLRCGDARARWFGVG
ncbi:phosphotransferase family protein [Micromonospora sp. HUAS LYJ1]|uniref:phosphotransferase family protein n=1 Tax=Micromonospora sp. HUAS LYJ1 TaxID=3061626 RepID=UPI0034A03866